MGSKLADGSDSEQYKIGDEFEVVDNYRFNKGSVVTVHQDDGSKMIKFQCIKSGLIKYEHWAHLKPHRKPFTKSDLKDGMRVELRCGKDNNIEDRWVCGHGFLGYGISYSLVFNDYDDNLEHDNSEDYDIMRVIDRDGSVVFEREPVKRKITIELTDDQIESLKQQGAL